jgi:hypothetical protein
VDANPKSAKRANHKRRQWTFDVKSKQWDSFPRKDHRLRNIAIIAMMVLVSIFGYLDLKILGVIGTPSGVSGYPKTILAETFTVSSLPNDNIPRSASWTETMNYGEEGKVTITISGDGLSVDSPNVHPNTVGPNAGTAYGNPPYTATFTVTTGGPILFGLSVFCGFGNYNGCLVSGHITVEALS